MTETQPPMAAAVPTPSPQEALMHMLMGMWSAQAVATAARLGLADTLAHSQPQESTALARAVGADAAALARLLRTLVSLGVLSQPQPHTYALTAIGAMLRSDMPGSMRDVLIAQTDTPHWQAWGKLHESVRSGQPMVPQLFGMPIFAYYAAHPEDLAAFSRAMGNFSALAAQGTVQHYDFAHAHGGDFFQSVPPGGDIYVLKFILHDWQDTEAVRILHNCRAAITSDGKLLVIEMVIPDDNHPSPAQLMDLNMLVMAGGQERTAGEYGALLAQAGFRLRCIIPTGSPFHVLEAVVV